MYSVRKLSRGDTSLDQIAALDIVAWGGTPEPDLVRAGRARLDRELAGGDAESVAVFFAGWAETIVAVCRVMRQADARDTWVAYGLAVHPAHRRRGLARRLYHAAIEHVRRHGGVTFRAYTHDDNTASRAFHEAMGLGPGTPTTAPDGDHLIGYMVTLHTLP